MATTALVAEIVVVGLQTGAWLALIWGLVTGAHITEEAMKALAPYATGITVIGLAAAYMLGVLIDRLSDSLYDNFSRTPVGRRINRLFGEDSHSYAKPAKIPIMRLTVMKGSTEVARFLDYQRTRWRIARGTLLNALIGVPVGAVYLHTTYPDRIGMMISVIVAGILFVILALFAAERIESAYIRRLSDAYLLITDPGPRKV